MKGVILAGGLGTRLVVEGLAYWIASGNVPNKLIGKRLVYLDMNSISADQFREVIEEISFSGKWILVIDEIHDLLRPNPDGVNKYFELLKPMLAEGRLQVLGTTTPENYQNIQTKNQFAQYFQPVTLIAPTPETTMSILLEVRTRYETHHKIQITDEALDTAARLATQYIAGRPLPDAAIDLIDDAASWVRTNRPPNIRQAKREIERLRGETNKAIASLEYESAAELRGKSLLASESLDQLEKDWEEKSKTRPTLTKEHIVKTVERLISKPIQE